MASTTCQFGVHLLSTAFAPLGSETNTLKALVKQEDKDIARLKDELTQLQASRNVHRALLAPICRLAPEILGEIFIHSLPDSPTAVAFDDAPLLLLHVCRRWRTVASRTPGLWQVLPVYVGFRSRSRFNYSSIIQMWMGNSRVLPVSVTLSGLNAREERIDFAAVELLFDHFYRVERFRGSCLDRLSTLLLRRGHPVWAPLLKRIEIESSTWRDQDYNEIAHLAGCIRAPNLEHIDLAMSTSALTLLSLKPESLRSLALRPIHRRSFPSTIESLSSCCNLRFLEIHIPEEIIGEHYNFTITGKVALPSLLHLTIRDCTSYLQTSQLLLALELVSLAHFTFSANKATDSSRFLAVLGTFLQGDPPPLQSLSLRSLELNPETFTPLLSRLSSLKSLALNACAIYAATIRSLTHDNSTSTDSICPRLSSLTFKRTHVPGDLAVRLVHSRASRRSHANIRLRQVVMEYCFGVTAGHVPALRKVSQSCGVNITVLI